MSADPVDIEAIKARVEAATPGEWFNAVEMIYVRTDDAPDEFGYSMVEQLGEFSSEENAVFVAHARTDILAALAALSAITAELEEYKAALVEVQRICEKERNAVEAATRAESIARSALAAQSEEES